jgi:all-trans-retinol 13,14-reductase
LHSTTVGERNGLHNLIPGFPEITEVEFVPHSTLHRAIFPSHDIRVPNRDLPGYIDILNKAFREEKEGIKGLFEEMKQLSLELNRLSRNSGKVDMMRFPVEYPTWSVSPGARGGRSLMRSSRTQSRRASSRHYGAITACLPPS